MLAMERKIINQSSAARIRGVSRQRISELYAKGRFTIPVDETGKQVKGAIYLDEVESLTEGSRGRPKLTAEQRAERGLDTYKVGDRIGWTHKPRDGYGYTINIDAVVVKIGARRLLLEFKDGNDNVTTAWVSRDLCVKYEA